MTPQDQLREDLAKAVGYYRDQKTGMWENENPQMRRLTYALPELTLDWLHECEATLSDSEKYNYAMALYRINPDAVIMASYDGEQDYDGWFTLIHSTAEQKAEAYLCAKGAAR